MNFVATPLPTRREPWTKRAELERAIEAAIAYLDQLDGSSDIEDDDPAEDNADRELDTADSEDDGDGGGCDIPGGDAHSPRPLTPIAILLERRAGR
ncbi:hypothetical protein [Dongia sp.]|uniref:hypothetical protein n=1 Tax=Dongia sp. TaxID=1977262 RepID=UPI003752107A